MCARAVLYVVEEGAVVDEQRGGAVELDRTEVPMSQAWHARRSPDIVCARVSRVPFCARFSLAAILGQRRRTSRSIHATHNTAGRNIPVLVLS